MKKKKVTNERRVHPRIDTDSLWVTERQGNVEFKSKVGNISEGGIFLEKRLLGTSDVSQLIIRTLKHNIQLEALSVREESNGVGYCFLNVSKENTKQLKSLIGSL